MPYIAVILLQIMFVVHAVRNGRGTMWIWIIVFVPVVGCAAYFITQVLPELHRDPTVRKAQNRLARAIDPERELRKLKDELAIADTQQNRMRLADECLEMRMYDDALGLYQRCLSGPNVDPNDPKVMLRIAEVYFRKGDSAMARATLDNLRKANPSFRSADGHLLYARSVEACGDVNAAREEYEALVQYYPGEEARVRYALLLKNGGQTEQARALFDETLIRARRSPKHYQRMQKQWIDMARSNLS